MKPLKLIASLIIIAVVTTGCAHPLKVRNMSLYKPEFIDTQHSNIRLGIMPSTHTPAEERLVLSIANDLKRNGFGVTNPYYISEHSTQNVDYVVKITSSSEFKGSGSNFFRNWPGFILWIPAIAGYKYTAKFNFDVDVSDTRRERTLPRISIPVDLDIRHADMNRTWTEISWLEVSIIAFVGGIVFMKYDDAVTALLMDTHEGRISEYVSSKISSALIAAEASIN